MAQVFSFVCRDCGKRHEGSPSLSFASPFFWDDDAERIPWKTDITSDLCIVDSESYFIRCVLEIPIIGASEPFTWGVWVSQSRENFLAYSDAFPNTPERITFGYLANRIPGYPDTLNLHTQAHWRTSSLRPWIELEAGDHPLYRDYLHGISWETAVGLAAASYHE